MNKSFKFIGNTRLFLLIKKFIQWCRQNLLEVLAPSKKDTAAKKMITPEESVFRLIVIWC
jgi:hypothetical protein